MQRRTQLQRYIVFGWIRRTAKDQGSALDPHGVMGRVEWNRERASRTSDRGSVN